MNTDTRSESPDQPEELPLALRLAQGMIEEKREEIEEKAEQTEGEFEEVKERAELIGSMKAWLHGIGEYLDHEELLNPYEWLEKGIESYRSQGMEFSTIVDGFLQELKKEYDIIDSAVEQVAASGAGTAESARRMIMGNEQLKATIKAKFEAVMEQMKKEMDEAHYQVDVVEKEEAFGRTGEFTEALEAMGEGVQMPEVAPANLETQREIFRQKQVDHFFGQDAERDIRNLNEKIDTEAKKRVRYSGPVEEEDRKEYIEKTSQGKRLAAKIKQMELMRDVVGPYLVDMMIKRIEKYLREQNLENADEVLKEFFSKQNFASEYRRKIMSGAFEIVDGKG
ncbi:hypothetical protein ACFLZH_05940, partial [Patescibacteria group bacterium]